MTFSWFICEILCVEWFAPPLLGVFATMRYTLILVLLGSGAAATLGAAESAQITSKQELKAAEASARTAADYERIGYYYRTQANDFRIKEAEEEQAAAQWASYYAGRAKTPNPYNSAKLLASYYENKAEQAASKADENLKSARASEKSPEITASRH